MTSFPLLGRIYKAITFLASVIVGNIRGETTQNMEGELRHWIVKAIVKLLGHSPKIYVVLPVNWCQTDLVTEPKCAAQFLKMFAQRSLFG